MSLVGTTLGSYRILEHIGEGGMGQVYLAEHQAIGKKAAIKVLRREVADQGTVQRFFNEARAANSIDHPGIIDVFDYGEDPAVGYYLVMDYLQGEPLSARLARRGALPPVDAARLVQRISSPLAAAHAAGIVHRDLKPDNVFLLPDPDEPQRERIVLLDFGIAKLSEHKRRGQQTATGTLMGTPLYMSPEQCHGAKHVDHRTDIYSLGVLAFEAVCGRPPFVADGFGEMIAKHLHEPPPPPSSLCPAIPREMEQALLRALAKDPAKRYPTIAALGAAMLRSVGLSTASGSSVADDALGETLPPPSMTIPATLPPGPTPGPTPPSAAPARSGRSWLPWVLGCSGLLVLAGGAVGASLLMADDADDVATADTGSVAPTAPRQTARAGKAATRSVVDAGHPDAGHHDASSDRLRGLCQDRHQLMACQALALRLWRADENRHREEVLGLLERACDGGVATACEWLGIDAIRVKRSPREAAVRFRRACELSHHRSCANLARLYLAGKGVGRDPSRARELLRTACEGGFKDACRQPTRVKKRKIRKKRAPKRRE
jgi:serine/threonine-protein kinase